MPVLQNPRHERYAQLIVETLNNGRPKPYSLSHAYLAVGYQTKDLGKRGGSTQAASSRLLSRVIHRVKELQHIAAKSAAETVEKMARELNEIQYEARADKAHAAAVAAVLGKAKVLNIIDCPSPNHIDFAQAKSMQDIGHKLLQSVGFREPDGASIAAAIEANDVFVRQLEEISAQAQGLTLDQDD
jgi:hypothetical protein